MAGIHRDDFAFRGTLTHPATQYVPLPCSGATLVGVHIAWLDATSSATITLETSNYNETDAPTSAAGSAWEWFSETGVTITGPSASAAGCSMKHLGNLGSKRARLKIVTAADCELEIRVHGKE